MTDKPKLRPIMRPPQSSPYRALARSCLRCGRVITTPDHLIRKAGGPLPGCRPCLIKAVRRWQKKRAEDDPSWRQPSYERNHERHTALNLARYQREQAETLERATRARQEWTGPELEIVVREDLPVKEIAAMLGRSYFAVLHMRQDIKKDPRKARLADVDSEVAERADPYSISRELLEAAAKAVSA